MGLPYRPGFRALLSGRKRNFFEQACRNGELFLVASRLQSMRAALNEEGDDTRDRWGRRARAREIFRARGTELKARVSQREVERAQVKN